MSNIKLTLKDGSVKEFPAGITAMGVAEALSRRLAKEALVARFNGKNIDLASPLPGDGELEIFTLDDPEGLEALRHSTSHVLAQAVKHLFPQAKLGIGPAIADGFYYDFDLPTPFTPEDLARLEEEMAAIVKADFPFKRFELPREEAIRKLSDMGETYKVELVENLPAGEPISFYEQGDFVDLCAGPHLPSTGRIKAFKLLSVAGAYWRGDEKRPMLQRIYGTAFPKQSQLEEHLARLEEAKKRDHRKLGVDLDLFNTYEEAGAGMVFFHPKGAMLRYLVEDFERREHWKRGYQMVTTPHILRADLWKTSGHYENFKENMYFTEIEGAEYGIKPMNCPGHILIYKSRSHSYREFPIRFFELGTVYRFERSGALHGLTRVRGFTQDDAHIFCLPEQIESEIKGVLDFAFFMMDTFGFRYQISLATRPEKSVGSDEIWEKATQALRNALDSRNLPYEVEDGGGAFYGPKIDIALKDALDRAWQGPTIQLDFNLPERFDMTYIGADGEKHRPVMIHRTVLGSMERFIGVLTEHYAGAFPVWLSPVQVKILPITDRQMNYANDLVNRLAAADIRVELDSRNEKIGYKIREAQLEKVPYMLVIGDKEVASGTVAVRERGKGDIGSLTVEEFLHKIEQEVREKK